MITKLVIRNFKCFTEQTFHFTNFDLLVGMNNCGKSTVLQALAIWQFCVEEFRRAKKHKGVQVVLPNFTALPVPEFNLLWTKRVDRKYTPLDENNKKKKQEYILIEIEVTWKDISGKEFSFGVYLRYSAPLTLYAFPKQKWELLKEFQGRTDFPRIAYVPPFSGLEPKERWCDISVIRESIGKGQPGSILRNLFILITQGYEEGDIKQEAHLEGWDCLKKLVERWFNVRLKEPVYNRGVDTLIKCEYKENGKEYDIISGGSGFHQVLTLLAFLYGFKPTTILFDEPDAHLHTKLQSDILEFLKAESIRENGPQVIVATHAEKLINAVDANRILSLLSGSPIREAEPKDVIAAMSIIANEDLVSLRNYPFIIYLEGESDARIIRAWSEILRKSDLLSKALLYPLKGGDKKRMVDESDEHFKALRKIFKNAARLIVLDYDDKASWHPSPNNLHLFEWSRKNIENYLLVQPAWERALEKLTRVPSVPEKQIINQFFREQGVQLLSNKNWRTTNANIFKVLDGKNILFEDADSLFNKMHETNPLISLTRDMVAGCMTMDELHSDIEALFNRIMEISSVIDTVNNNSETYG